MSAPTSVTPPSATPSVPPQGLPFPPPQSITAGILTNAGPNTTQSTEPTTAPPLPPPQTFDILPPLHALLARLEPSLNTYTTDPVTTHNAAVLGTSTGNTNGTPSFESSVTGPSSQSTAPVASASLTQTTANQHTELAYKDVVSATQPLRAKMRRALAELAKLGDMSRGVQEQEEEIGELTRRIEGQRAVLGRLAELAAQAGYSGNGTVEMGEQAEVSMG